MSEVTRMEIVDAVEGAFSAGAADKHDLIEAAVRNRARPELVETLHRLPARRFGHVRDVWPDLPDVPVDN